MFISQQFTNKFWAPKIHYICIALAAITMLRFCNTKAYAQTTNPVAPDGLLTRNEEKLIHSLPTNPEKIPAWLIAELLPRSTKLHRGLVSNNYNFNSIKIVQLNQLLANPDKYQAKLIALKALFATSEPVAEKLNLIPPDRCWSVISLDVKYLHPIQCFTSQRPCKFRKGRQIYIIGYYITNRLARQENNKEILVPVIIGTALPTDAGFNQRHSGKNFKGFLGLIAILVLLYLIIRIYIERIYIGKKYNKNSDFYIRK